ncbi:hypothetical protein AURANDRAFT_35793 [Aureococcus anophagefferens]|uniref:Uncharacterized protein n=1 Tax=Aureococcus anophagefferens TaxID=44056 RepID=F0XV94_AURAN|nr:hypothetical protein AURANDRAFT_35793 [Aureococcus anophagefferens]EGB12549.1 hypothetical protein AURANDRAFT_35793 [Aureococcus anophagefferens]|eukprot:XP_009032221.1 hypothetical protein AURANDRAFT_35793 [Aureococcus anophagefferens]
MGMLRVCCCRTVCRSCEDKIGIGACPLCRVSRAESDAENLARLRRHVENEVPEAITFLGTAYRRGYFGLVKSDKKAAKIWKRAVELGDVEAMSHLAELYEDGSGVKLDKKKAERLYRMAADRGDAYAQNSLGSLLDAEKKHEEAFRYFALAANQGETFAEISLGCCYRLGQGTEVDLGKARYWFERAAAKGDEDAKAITFLGEAYFRGLLGLVKSDKKAAKIWKRAVELGNVDAMVVLGVSYQNGSGVKLDKKKAERLFRMAADRGHAVAQSNLGILLYHEEKFEEAFRYFVLAADQGFTDGENNLGCCYRDGKGTEVDLGKARYWLERAAAKGTITSLGNAYRRGYFGLVKSDKKAAKIWKRAVELGNVDAMVHLGILHQHGTGVKLDKKKAERLYRMAADRGDPVAQCNVGKLLDSEEKHEEAFRYYALAADQGFTPGETLLGLCYHEGEGTEVDLGKARYWFERAAAKGNEDAKAITFLGSAYRGGRLGLVKSDKKAAKIYRRAVELGDVDAMAFLGEMYDAEDGEGVKLDKKKAERLYRAAADRGDAHAQNNLGVLLYCEKKFEEAVRYYALAANQGYTDGEYNLGCWYRDGKGTEVDVGKARYWFERAAAKGDEDARKNLACLDARV